jgi:magnesium-transporting ATPase (P-type)
MRHLKTFESYNRHSSINEAFDFFYIDEETKRKIQETIEKMKTQQQWEVLINKIGTQMTEEEIQEIETNKEENVEDIQKDVETENYPTEPTNEEFNLWELGKSFFRWVLGKLGIIGAAISSFLGLIEIFKFTHGIPLGPMAWVFAITSIVSLVVGIVQSKKRETPLKYNFHK